MSELAFYQIVIVLLAGGMIFQGIYKYLKHQSGQTIIKVLVRMFVWGSMAIIVLFPNLTNTLAKLIGIADNINAVILTGFILVFLMIFKLLSAIERLEQQITILTRKDTLETISARGEKTTL